MGKGLLYQRVFGKLSVTRERVDITLAPQRKRTHSLGSLNSFNSPKKRKAYTYYFTVLCFGAGGLKGQIILQE